MDRWTRLEEKLDALMRRVEQLEKLQGSPGSDFVPRRVLEESIESPRALAALLTPESLAAQALEKVGELQGSREKAPQVSQILGLIAIVCFVLAGAFLIRLAIQSGWLTPERQWGCVVLLGLALTGVGRFADEIEKQYRAYLSVAGVIVLHLAALSSSLYFELTPKPFSLVLGMGATGICLALYRYHRSELFGVLAAVGTYVSPLLLRHAGIDLPLLAGYFILWSGLYAWLSITFRSRTLSLLSAYLSIALFTAMTEKRAGDSELAIILSTLCIQFVLATLGVIGFSVRRGVTLTEREAWSYFPVLSFFYGTSYYFLSRLLPGGAPWIALGFAAFLPVDYGYAKRRLKVQVLPSSDVVQAFLALALFHAKYLQILPSGAKPWLIPIWIAILYASKHAEAFPRMSKHLRAAGHAVATIEFLKLCWAILEPGGVNTGLESVPLVVVSLGAAAIYYLRTPLISAAETVGLLGMSHILALVTLYRAGESHGSLAVSAGWILYSGLVLGVGYRLKDVRLANSSLLVLSVATLKALTYDASHAGAGVRVLCLLTTGILLYGSGLLFRRMSLWRTPDGEEGMASSQGSAL